MGVVRRGYVEYRLPLEFEIKSKVALASDKAPDDTKREIRLLLRRDNVRLAHVLNMKDREKLDFQRNDSS